MIINRNMILSILVNPRNIIPKISKGINHDSTVVAVELLTSDTDVEFIFERMQA